MKLEELKALVKEEYDKFMYEQEDEEKDKKDDKEDDKGDDKSKADDKPKADAKPKAPKAPKVDVGPKDLDVGGDDENPEETLRAIYDMLKDFFEGDKDDDKATGMDMPSTPGMPSNDAPMVDTAMALQERFKKLANIIK